MHKISVIIPLYNTECYIKQCIDSVLSQEGADVECIVVDDCGEDNSLQKILDYNDSRIKVIKHSSNRGLSVSRNSGVSAATGEWIMFLDSDDFLLKNALKTFTSHIADGVEWIEGQFLRIQRDRQWPSETVDAHYKSHSEIVDHYQKINLTNVTAKLFRADIVKNNPLEQDLIFEDVYWCQKRYPKLSNIVVTNTPVYGHNLSENSIMRSRFTQKKIDSMLYIIEQIMADNPDRNQQQTLALLTLYLIKNIYMEDFSRDVRDSVISKLKSVGANKLQYDRNLLPPFTKQLSLGLKPLSTTYFKLICYIYKSYLTYFKKS